MANTIESGKGTTSNGGSALIFFGLVLVAIASLASPILARIWPAPPVVQRIEVVGPVSVTSGGYGELRVYVTGDRAAPSGAH